MGIRPRAVLIRAWAAGCPSKVARLRTISGAVISAWPVEGAFFTSPSEHSRIESPVWSGRPARPSTFGLAVVRGAEVDALIDLQRGVDAQCSHHLVGVGVGGRRLRRELAQPHHHIGEGVIMGELEQGAGAAEVDAAVADVGDVQRLPVDDQGQHHRAGHGLLALEALGFGEDRRVGGAHGRRDQPGDLSLLAGAQLVHDRIHG